MSTTEILDAFSPNELLDALKRFKEAAKALAAIHEIPSDITGCLIDWESFENLETQIYNARLDLKPALLRKLED